MIGRWMCRRGLHAWHIWFGNPTGRIMVTKRWCARTNCDAIRVDYWP